MYEASKANAPRLTIAELREELDVAEAWLTTCPPDTDKEALREYIDFLQTDLAIRGLLC